MINNATAAYLWEVWKDRVQEKKIPVGFNGYT